MTRRDRDEDGRGGFEAWAAGIESGLRRLAPAPVPAGLRERVLERAAATRRSAALAPWVRVAAGACAVLVAALLALDPLLSRHEERRLTALFDGRSAATPTFETAPELAEAGLGRGTEAERWARIQDLAAEAARRSIEIETVKALERLKGWWEYETPESPY